MRLILVRHGETDWNATLRYQGQNQVSLNELGRRQALRAAEAIGEASRAAPPLALYASDVVRAWETALIMGQALGLVPQPLPGFREVDVGQWEGLTPEELVARFPEHMAEVERSPAQTVRLGGESYAQMQRRVLAALDELAGRYPAQTVVAVSHGGVIRALICHLLGAPLERFQNMWLDNGSLSTIVAHPRYGWRLIQLNDVCHLRGVDQAREGGE